MLCNVRIFAACYFCIAMLLLSCCTLLEIAACREDPDLGPIVAGLSRIQVESAEKILSLLQASCRLDALCFHAVEHCPNYTSIEVMDVAVQDKLDHVQHISLMNTAALSADLCIRMQCKLFCNQP